MRSGRAAFTLMELLVVTSFNYIPTAYYNPPAEYDYKWSAD
jgi:hypothetical protein